MIAAAINALAGVCGAILVALLGVSIGLYLASREAKQIRPTSNDVKLAELPTKAQDYSTTPRHLPLPPNAELPARKPHYYTAPKYLSTQATTELPTNISATPRHFSASPTVEQPTNVQDNSATARRLPAPPAGELPTSAQGNSETPGHLPAPPNADIEYESIASQYLYPVKHDFSQSSAAASSNASYISSFKK